MQITKLRLSGFKSFAEPTDLVIEVGLTGIVGPNGCGKSNLFEAIRWVMGEGSAKSMRSDAMDDVIFAGTTMRPSRNFAEVVLACDTQGATIVGVLDTEISGAVEITRRIERGLGSAYRVNGRDVRARDVALLFADSATGARSPALVRQGQIAAIIAAKPAERRAMLEEAAAIAGLHVRRKDAEQKLRAAEATIARLQEIAADIGVRAQALRRQARTAETYRQLSDKIHMAQGRMIYAQWCAAVAAVQRDQQTVGDSEAKLSQARAQQEQRTVLQQEDLRDLTAARVEDSTARAQLHDTTARLAQLRGEAQAVRQQLTTMQSEQTRLGDDRMGEENRYRQAQVNLNACEQAAKDVAAALAAHSTARAPLDQARLAAQERLVADEAVLADRRAQVANAAAERNRLEAARDSAIAQTERLQAERIAIATEIAQLDDSAECHKQQDLARQAADGAQAAIALYQTTLRQGEHQREALAQAVLDSAAQLGKAQAILAGVEEQIAALDQALADDNSDSPARLSDLIYVESGYEKALAAALGEDLEAGEAMGAQQTTAVQVGEAEQAVTAVRGTVLTPQPHSHSQPHSQRYWISVQFTRNEMPSLPPHSQPLSDYVTAPMVLTARLAQIAVVEQDRGQQLAVGQRLVTRDGYMRRWDGFVSHGEGAANAMRLARRNRRADLQKQRPTCEAMLTQAQAHRGALVEESEALDKTLADSRQHRDDSEAAHRAALQTVDRTQAALERQRDRATLLALRQREINQAEAEARQISGQAQAAVVALPDDQQARETLAIAEQQRMASHQKTIATAEAYHAHEQELARLHVRQAAIDSDIRNGQARLVDLAQRLAETERRAADIADQIAMLADKPEQMERACCAREAEATQLQEQVACASAAEHQAQARLTVSERNLDDIKEAVAKAREHRVAAHIRSENSTAQEAQAAQLSLAHFACPPDHLPTKFSFAENSLGDREQEKSQYEAVVVARDRLGAVNLLAEDELETITQQHEQSLAEIEELTEAIHRLRGSIARLDSEGRKRLRVAFAEVNQHFQRLFTSLFGGGRAYLSLIDSDDPLQAGLEIMAQPPGKHLASLSLLSGGEQALVALSLIFALFLTSPAPICVLDEVDAPLDDANVVRFCDLLDQMLRESDTRYLIITHNALTMARMQRLYGVTMAEKGVSRLVSVDLTQIEDWPSPE